MRNSSHKIVAIIYVEFDDVNLFDSFSGGKLSRGVNREGIAFYNNVFNELLANGKFKHINIYIDFMTSE